MVLCLLPSPFLNRGRNVWSIADARDAGVVCVGGCYTRGQVDVTWEQALAVFRKHDTTASGALRFTSFANALLQGASRAISKVRARRPPSHR